MLTTILWITLALALAVWVCRIWPEFGRLPRGGRLERVEQSPNYRNGKFQNLSPTAQLTSDKSMLRNMLDFLSRRVEGLRPAVALPAVKTDLHGFGPDEEVMVWLGHSTVYFQTGGKRFLVDPVLVKAAPVRFVNRPFKGTAIYTPADLPAIDYLIVTHDHWDHLDYSTVKAIMPRTGRVVCSLGVGESLEYWGFGHEQIIELDWNESDSLPGGITIHCLPARHFSGRGPAPNKTLWASWMVQTPSRNIYISGDGGYDSHFSQIAARFGSIDLAILENGQYNEAWKLIHMLPEDLARAAGELNATRLMTVHNSKYALGMHSWHEPLDKIAQAAQRDSLPLLTPRIGEPVRLDDTEQVFERWWENIE